MRYKVGQLVKHVQPSLGFGQGTVVRYKAGVCTVNFGDKGVIELDAKFITLPVVNGRSKPLALQPVYTKTNFHRRAIEMDTTTNSETIRVGQMVQHVDLKKLGVGTVQAVIDGVATVQFKKQIKRVTLRFLEVVSDAIKQAVKDEAKQQVQPTQQPLAQQLKQSMGYKKGTWADLTQEDIDQYKQFYGIVVELAAKAAFYKSPEYARGKLATMQAFPMKAGTGAVVKVTREGAPQQTYSVKFSQVLNEDCTTLKTITSISKLM